MAHGHHVQDENDSLEELKVSLEAQHEIGIGLAKTRHAT